MFKKINKPAQGYFAAELACQTHLCDLPMKITSGNVKQQLLSEQLKLSLLII